MTIYKKAVFTIDGLEGEEFEGYTVGSFWNGWACPLFTKEVAERVMDAICQWGNTKAWYVEETDTFYTNLNCADGECFEEDTEWHEGEYRRVNGEVLNLYCVGGFSWCWSEELKETTEYQEGLIKELSQVLFKISEECEESNHFHNIMCDLNAFNRSIDEVAHELLGMYRK